MSRAPRLLPFALVTLTLALVGCPVAEPTPLPMPSEPAIRDGRWAMQLSDVQAWGDCDGAERMALGGALLPLDVRHNARGRLILESEGLQLRGEQHGRSIVADGALGGGPEPVPYEAAGAEPMPSGDSASSGGSVGCGDCGDCGCWTEPVEPMPEPCGDEGPVAEDDAPEADVSEPGTGFCGGSPGDEDELPTDCGCGCDCPPASPAVYVAVEAELRHAEALEGSLLVEIRSERGACQLEAQLVAAFLSDAAPDGWDVWAEAPVAITEEASSGD
jgi:hypothetical protein